MSKIAKDVIEEAVIITSWKQSGAIDKKFRLAVDMAKPGEDISVVVVASMDLKGDSDSGFFIKSIVHGPFPCIDENGKLPPWCYEKIKECFGSKKYTVHGPIKVSILRKIIEERNEDERR